jgi:ribosomal protein S18 acetylase RimI-like enzyme
VNCLRLALLAGALEQNYWRVVKQDYCDYYFFVYDVLLQPERTRVFLALEGEQIVGLMLVYNDYNVQLRGCPDAVGFLLSSLGLAKAEVEAPLDSEEMVLAKYPAYKHKEKMTMMTLERGREKLDITVEPERLTCENAKELAELMRESYPLMWSDMTAETVKVLTGPDDLVILGVRGQDGKLAAFGTAMLTDDVGLVCWLATREKYRNKGYCTSILSSLVKEGLKKADKMAIHVLEDNFGANRIYKRVGFEFYKQYFLLCV